MRKTYFTSLIQSRRSAGPRRRFLHRLANGTRLATGIAVLAGGMTFAGVAQATQVINEDFEVNPSPNTTWTFTSYGTGDNYSNSPHSGVPGGGSFYGWNPGIGAPQATTHTVDFASTLSGAEQTAITEGKAQWNFNGWLAAYTANDDHTVFTTEYFDGPNGTGNSLGSITMANGSLFTAADGVTEYVDSTGTLQSGDSGADFFNWKHYVTSGGVGVGAASAVFTYEGQATVNNANDAYADNIMIDIVATPNEQFLKLVVNKTTGMLTMENNTTGTLDVNFYEIISPGGTLNNGWNSFADQGLDSQGPNAEDNWLEGGGSDANLLTEAFLTASSPFDVAETQNLANGYSAGEAGAEDLVFQYGLDNDALLRGIVKYTTGGGIDGDFDFDGDVDGNDFLVWQRGYPSAPHDAAGLVLWQENFGSPSLAAATSAVPEPGCLLLFGMGLASVSLIRRTPHRG